MRSWASMSAQPITPRPIFRLPLVIFSISGRGYAFTSMTLSRKWVEDLTTRANRAQSISEPPSVGLTMRDRFIDPRLQLS